MLILGKKINFRAVFWIIFFFFVFGLLLRNSLSYLDPDLGWHLKVGQEISASAQVPHLNIYNYTFTGNWVDHEWLSNLISFQIYNYFNYFYLNIFFALVIVVSLLIIFLVGRKKYPGAPDWLWATLILFGLIASLPHFGVRMQEFGFLFLAFELWIISAYSRKRKWPLLFLFLPLFYLWANMHASFLIGLVLLFAWPWSQLLIKRLNWKNLFVYSGLGVLAFGLTFLTPYRSELYSFLSGYRHTFYMGVIQEWAPQFYFPLNYWQLLFLSLTLLVFGLYLYQIYRQQKGKIKLWEFSLLVLFIILSFRSRRHFPLLVVVALPFLADALTSLLDLEQAKFIFKQNILKYLIWLTLILATLAQFIAIRPVNNPFSHYCEKFPCRATLFLKNNEQYNNYRLFNDYNWGGYLIWQIPERKLFIDGRLPQADFSGKTLIEEYLSFYEPKADLSAKLNQYDIKLVLIKTHDDRLKFKKWEQIIFRLKENQNETPNYLRTYLESSPEWQKIYRDPFASIYLKKD
ncbi:MAG: hypothetical protein WC467_04635 [Patescibacteria group bacterium]